MKSDARLTGTALVTGASRRIGRAIALALAGEGLNVVVHYRSSETEAGRLVDELQSLGAGAWAVQGDLSDEKQASTLLDRAEAESGPLSTLVNNASMFPGGTLADLNGDELFGNIQVNTMAPLQLARTFAARGTAASVVNLLDSRITDYDANHVAYHLSKRMLFDLTRIMALEFAPNVRVNAVAPGLILPPPGKDDSYVDALTAANPLHSRGTPEQVAAAVVFLLKSPFITGQVIFVDGGRHMKGNVYGC